MKTPRKKTEKLTAAAQVHASGIDLSEGDASGAGYLDGQLLIAMPVMDGIEATGSVRQAGNMITDKNVPIIAMTAHAMKGDREQFLAAGMDDYIGKPINSDNLCNMLLKHLQRARRAAECASASSPA